MRVVGLRTLLTARWLWVREACLHDYRRYPLLLPLCDRRGVDTGLLIPRALALVID